MATRDELESLRAEIRKRQKAANAKISRLRSRGVELAGTQFDVRRNVNRIKTYNAKQLRGYLGRLNAFTSRSTGFVGDVNGSPIPIQKWRQYKRLETKYNSKGNRELDRFGNIKLPFGDANVRQRRDTLIPKGVVRAQGTATRAPYEPINRRPGRLASIDALEKLINDMERRNSQKYLPEQIADQREQMNDMLTALGMPEYVDRANKLSDDQFNVMFNYTSFVNEVSLEYENAKLRAIGERDKIAENIGENSRREVESVITWAEQLPKKIR